MAGYFLRARSQLDGKPIVLVLTGRSRNAKVGDIVQTWIMRDRINPYDAVHNGGDVSICGECPRRPSLGGDCYVSIYRGPHAIWRSVREGRATPFDFSHPPACLMGKMVRIGAYGDPTAIPLTVWTRLIKTLDATGWVGYTHQWQQRRFQAYKRYLMASCDTFGERTRAKQMGWRTFRARGRQDKVAIGEFVCPASTEGGKKVTCQKCRLCSGGASRAKDPVIIAHGLRNPQGLVALRRR